MRRQSALSGLRLALFLLFAANFNTSSSQFMQINYAGTQEHLVCKKPESQLCVTWHLGPVDPDIIIEESPSNATQFCGLSDLKRILPHRKFITEFQEMLTSLNDVSQRVGLVMNLDKTKVMFNSHVVASPITVDGIALEVVSEYTYLGKIGQIIKKC